MIVKRIRKIAELTSLITIRQLVFLGKNLYNLAYSPFLTIKEIIDKKDKSQIILMISVIMSPAIVYTFARVVWDKFWYGGLLRSIGPVFNLFFVIESIFLLYVAYWSFQVWRRK